MPPSPLITAASIDEIRGGDVECDGHPPLGKWILPALSCGASYAFYYVSSWCAINLCKSFLSDEFVLRASDIHQERQFYNEPHSRRYEYFSFWMNSMFFYTRCSSCICIL
jgi:hypothetical protein